MNPKIIVLLFLLFSSHSKATGLYSKNKDTANYVLLNEKGKKVKLSDFKGKVLYVDFWASWCAGCKELMKLSKGLHAKLSKQQQNKIVFVYISIDNDSLAWRKAVNQVSNEGVNLLAPANISNAAGNYFRVTGLPRYMTIDKKGKVAAFIAKSPQQEGIYEDLIRLIDQKD